MKKIYALLTVVFVAANMMAATVMTCAEAAAAASSTSQEVQVTGYVTEIATAWSDQYKNISFWMSDTENGGRVLQAYRASCQTEDDAPSVGDIVTITGNLILYNKKTPEISAGGTYMFVKKATKITMTSETATFTYTNQISSKGRWQLKAKNSDYQLSLTNSNYVSQIGGTYSASDLNHDVSYLYTSYSGYSYFEGGSITITESDNGFQITGRLSGSDQNDYALNVSFTYPQANNNVYSYVYTSDWQDNTGDGYFNIYGYDYTNSIGYMLYVSSDSMTGSYTVNDLFPVYSYVTVNGEDIHIYSAEINVYSSYDYKYEVYANLLCYNNTMYYVTFYLESLQAVDNVEAAGKVSKKIENGQLIIEKAGVRYNAQGAEIK